MWNYIQPVEIKFGAGRISEITNVAEGLNVSRGILVSTGFFVRNGLAEKIVEMSNGKIVGIFSDFSPNPDVSEVNACSDLIKSLQGDFVIALGGGSVMDGAKAAASICLTDDKIEKYHGTGVAMPVESLPLIAVPTTSGTGSEVTCVSVLTDRALKKKAPIVSDGFYPKVALVDPELTYSTPPEITASTGLDVLCHAVEGFWSTGNQPICDAYALHATELVIKHLYEAFSDSDNKAAKDKMAEASVIAGLAFTLPKTTSSHACSFPLTNIYKIPHGEACALTLDYFMRINASDENNRINEFSRKLGFEDANTFADYIFELKQKMGLLTDLKSYNLSEMQIAELVKISRHPNLYNNPVEITDEMLYEMYNSFVIG